MKCNVTSKEKFKLKTFGLWNGCEVKENSGQINYGQLNNINHFSDPDNRSSTWSTFKILVVLFSEFVPPMMNGLSVAYYIWIPENHLLFVA